MSYTFHRKLQLFPLCDNLPDRDVAGHDVANKACMHKERAANKWLPGAFYLPFDEAGCCVRRRASIRAFEAALAFRQLPGQL